MPKPHVHLLGPLSDFVLDARQYGGERRFIRSGCRPNAVLQPMLYEPSRKDADERTEGMQGQREKADKETSLGFGVYALRYL